MLQAGNDMSCMEFYQTPNEAEKYLEMVSLHNERTGYEGRYEKYVFYGSVTS